MPLHDKAFYLSLFFIIGTLAAGFNLRIWWALVGAFLISRILFSLSTKRALIFTGVCFLGFFYLHFYNVVHKDVVPFGEDTRFGGVIVEEPREEIDSTRVTIKLNEPHKGEIWLYTSPGTTFKYGEEITFQGVVEISPGGVNVVSFPGELAVTGEDRGNSIRGALIGLKNTLIAKLEAVLPAEHASLASGFLLGERAD
ncbi:MAG: DUF4131 domain-containing protein, partial [Candidatus Colwellbacteria bacterium]|nr:DUF4131 domain-containing protein [Candidatus Colwellbacteria bacterium]